MPVNPDPMPLMLELCAGHALAMQCGARATQFLDRAAAAGWDERANLEALRMAGLTARLMEGVQRLVPRVRAATAASTALASRPRGRDASGDVGVHRSDRRGQGTDDRRQKAPLPVGTFPAGHGLHRSFRDRLRSSVAA